MVEIISNGSKWAGEAPDSLAELLDVLKRETLDPRFEEYGNFIQAETDAEFLAEHPGFVDTWHAFGNFLTVSHVFNIRGTHEELAELERAIRANQATAAYKVAAGGKVRKRTRFETCEKHRWLELEGRRRRAEFFVEGGPAGQGGCRGGLCRLWPGTDIFEASVCFEEMHLDWTEEVV